MSNKDIRIRDYHWKRLIKVVREHGVKVSLDERKSALDSGSFPWSKRIFLGLDSKDVVVYIALAHELGHCLDKQNAYKIFQRTMEIENRAWNLGWRFLRTHGFPITESMKKWKTTLLKSIGSSLM